MYISIFNLVDFANCFSTTNKDYSFFIKNNNGSVEGSYYHKVKDELKEFNDLYFIYHILPIK